MCMKKSLGLIILTVALLSSCQTLVKTARTADITSQLQSATVADLEAADQRVSHTLQPSKEIRRGGVENVKKAAEAEVLQKHNADVLIEPRYVISKKRTLFGSKITSITVSGRPASYKNYRSLSDSVWSNPVFRGKIKGIKMYSVPTATKSTAKGTKTLSQPKQIRKKGFEKHLKLSAGTITDDIQINDREGIIEDLFTFSALVDVGYRFAPQHYIGIGSGIIWQEGGDGDYEYERVGDTGHFPLFLAYRFDLSKNNIKSFFFETGFGGVYDSNQDEFFSPFYDIAFGYCFGKLELSLRYSYIKTESSYSVYDKYNYYDFEVEHDKKFVGISLGYRF